MSVSRCTMAQVALKSQDRPMEMSHKAALTTGSMETQQQMSISTPTLPKFFRASKSSLVTLRRRSSSQSRAVSHRHQVNCSGRLATQATLISNSLDSNRVSMTFRFYSKFQESPPTTQLNTPQSRQLSPRLQTLFLRPMLKLLLLVTQEMNGSRSRSTKM